LNKNCHQVICAKLRHFIKNIILQYSLLCMLVNHYLEDWLMERYTLLSSLLTLHLPRNGWLWARCFTTTWVRTLGHLENLFLVWRSQGFTVQDNFRPWIRRQNFSVWWWWAWLWSWKDIRRTWWRWWLRQRLKNGMLGQCWSSWRIWLPNRRKSQTRQSSQKKKGSQGRGRKWEVGNGSHGVLAMWACSALERTVSIYRKKPLMTCRTLRSAEKVTTIWLHSHASP